MKLKEIKQEGDKLYLFFDKITEEGIYNIKKLYIERSLDDNEDFEESGYYPNKEYLKPNFVQSELVLGYEEPVLFDYIFLGKSYPCIKLWFDYEDDHASDIKKELEELSKKTDGEIRKK